MNITEITSSDVEEFASLYASTFNLPPWNENWSVESAASRLICYRNTPNFVGFSARNDNELVGFIFGNYEPYQDESLFLLKEMCVHSNYQRSAIGTQLLNELHLRLSKERISTVNLLTRTGSSAESFYLKNGYYKSQSTRLYVARLST